MSISDRFLIIHVSPERELLCETTEKIRYGFDTYRAWPKATVFTYYEQKIKREARQSFPSVLAVPGEACQAGKHG